LVVEASGPLGVGPIRAEIFTVWGVMGSEEGAGAVSAFRFDRFILDLDRGALMGNGQESALRAKSFVLLCHFVESTGRLIDRDEIMRTVWPLRY
jgi:DNA-binding response OmpR family regulator